MSSDTGNRPLLRPAHTKGASVREVEPGCWKLEIPGGPKGKYRLAQLDDYTHLRRRNYPRNPPFQLSLRARSSSGSIPGTWGFGLWNDPFGMGIIGGVDLVRLPALPNTAWFFFSSPENYLSLRDDLPSTGATAGVFRSPKIPTPLLALGAPGAVLALFKPGVRLLRRLARLLVKQETVLLEIDPTEWHSYRLDWQKNSSRFWVDESLVLETNTPPLGPMGLVIWVDNQYAALSPSGEARFGTLENDPAWIEVSEIK